MHGPVVLLTVLAVVNGFEIPHEKVLNLQDGVKYRDCQELLASGLYTEPGAYNIYLNSSEPIQVYCRFENRWARYPIMQQKYGRENFKRTFQEYMFGFGRASRGDFWLGLSKMKQVADAGNRVLRVTLQNWGNEIKTIQYNYFSLGSWTKRFPLRIGGYVSSHVLPDDFSHNNGMPFSTIDRPDRHSCALHQGGGWWYNYCTFTLPTGHYYTGGAYNPIGQYYDGIYYKDWLGYGYSLKYIKMELSAN